MKKEIFEQIKSGLEDIKAHREGKLKLRTHEIVKKQSKGKKRNK